MAAKKPVVKKSVPKTTAKAKPVIKAEVKKVAVKPVKKAAVKAVAVKKAVKPAAPKKAVAAKAPAKTVKTKQLIKVKKVEAVKKKEKTEKAKVEIAKVEKVVKKVVAPKKTVEKVKPAVVAKAKVVEAPKPVAPKPVEKPKSVFAAPAPVPVAKPKAPEKPKPTKLRYTREELNEFKTLILEKQSEAINNLQTIRDQMLDPSTGEYINENSPYSLHMAEQGTDAMEKEKNYFYAQREQKFLGYLEEALKRIESGTYGLCKDCIDDPKMLCPTCPLIPKERLEAVPHSQQCVQLKKMQEKPRLR